MRTTASRNLRTLASIQVLSGIIGCLCIAFLIISILYSFSSQNFIDRLSFQPWPKNIYRKTNANKQKPIIDTISLNNESFICDYVKSNNESDTKSSLSFENHRLNALRPYCDFLPIPQKKWVPARRYKESDIVFVIFTAASFYHGRATSIRDTWLSRVTNKYFFSATPYPTLPVTVIKGVGEGYTSNMKKAYIGMQLAYQEHNQTAKFYFLAGCDTFVNIPHILKRLDGFDYTQPLVIGGYPFKHVCYHKKEQTPDVIVYPSGGAGFLLSARMMEMMYPKLTDFFEEDWPIIDVPYNDVAVNCLAYSLGVKPSLLPGFWAFSPEQTLDNNGIEALQADPEPNTFHYVEPPSMYTLDEFYVFQHIDRLANDENLNELVKFTRQFVAAHYELLRIKTAECTLPTVKTREK